MNAPCRLCSWSETYLDGELSPEHTVEFEDHLAWCCGCQSKLKFEQALRFSLRRAVRVQSYPSETFQAKIQAQLMAMRDAADSASMRDAAIEPDATPRPVHRPVSPLSTTLHSRPLTWRAITPLSVAAAAALVFAALRNEPTEPGAAAVQAGLSGSSISSRDTMQTVREFLDQVAADTEHGSDGTTEMVEESDPQPFLVVPPSPATIPVIHGGRFPAPKLDRFGGILEGLRIRHMARAGQVPSLHYRLGNHRVLLWAYDSERVPLRVVLEPHVARNHPVFVGTHHGMTVAAVERHGQGFVATTDLTQPEAAELVVTAVAH